MQSELQRSHAKAATHNTDGWNCSYRPADYQRSSVIVDSNRKDKSDFLVTHSSYSSPRDAQVGYNELVGSRASSAVDYSKLTAARDLAVSDKHVTHSVAPESLVTRVVTSHQVVSTADSPTSSPRHSSQNYASTRATEAVDASSSSLDQTQRDPSCPGCKGGCASCRSGPIDGDSRTHSLGSSAVRDGDGMQVLVYGVAQCQTCVKTLWYNTVT